MTQRKQPACGKSDEIKPEKQPACGESDEAKPRKNPAWKRPARLKRSAVKEAFDNLPSGIYFFDENGMVTLCNYQMHRLVFALTGRDLQSLSDLQAILKKEPEGVFVLDDGSAWRFFSESVTTLTGNTYTQIMAADVTQLYLKQQELREDNQRLEEYAERMRRLSANIITLIREEEILNTKMRVHDDIGRSVIATRQFLKQNRPMEELDLHAWKMAVGLLKHDNEAMEDKDGLAQLRSAADGLKIKIIMSGNLPQDAETSGLLLAAVRECMSNAVRHAGADEMYVTLSCEDHYASAVITNNGAVPEGKVTEGGGLSSLRVRISKCGGSMELQSTPGFKLTVSVPVRGEKER